MASSLGGSLRCRYSPRSSCRHAPSATLAAGTTPCGCGPCQPPSTTPAAFTTRSGFDKETVAKSSPCKGCGLNIEHRSFLVCFQTHRVRKSAHEHRLPWSRTIDFQSTERIVEKALLFDQAINQYYCNVCSNFRSRDRMEVKRHIEENHAEPKQYHCIFCNMKKLEAKELVEHVEKQHKKALETFHGDTCPRFRDQLKEGGRKF